MKSNAPNKVKQGQIRKAYAEGKMLPDISNIVNVKEESVKVWVDHFIAEGKVEAHSDYVSPEDAEAESDDDSLYEDEDED